MDRNEVSRRGLVLGGLGLAAVWSTTVGAPAALATSTRAAPVGTALVGTAADAVTAPPTVDCAGWGARPPRSAVRVHARRPVKIVVHHTATPNVADGSRGAGDGLARRIQAFHMDSRGWIDSGQHLTITRGGHLLEGRHRSLEMLRGGRQQVEAAHCTGQNIVAVGIETEGTYLDHDPPAAAWNRLRETCAWICDRYGIAPTEVYGHRDFVNTACPGRMHGMLPRLRAEVATLMGSVLAESEAIKASWPLLARRDTGRAVRAAQHLLRAAGHDDVIAHGVFDRRTEDAVRRFQQDQGRDDPAARIPAEEINGLLGAASWPYLVRDVRRGGADTPAQREAERAVDVLVAGQSGTGHAGLPAVVTTAVWQDLLGTGGSPMADSVDPVRSRG